MAIKVVANPKSAKKTAFNELEIKKFNEKKTQNVLFCSPSVDHPVLLAFACFQQP